MSLSPSAARELDELRQTVVGCLHRIDELERRLPVASGDGAATAPPHAFRIREEPLAADRLLQPEPTATMPANDDPFAFLNVSPISHTEDPAPRTSMDGLLSELGVSASRQ